MIPTSVGPEDLLGRRQVLGVVPSTLSLSTAFESAGEVGFAPPGVLDGCLADPALLKVVAKAVERVLRAVGKHVGASRWVWAFGESPDGLAGLQEARAFLPGLLEAFRGPSESEAVALLARIALRPDGEGRLSAARRARLEEGGRPDRPPMQLALERPLRGTAARFLAFTAHGDAPFFFADRTLGLRFRFSEGCLRFNAHHPLFREAMIERCQKIGLEPVG